VVTGRYRRLFPYSHSYSPAVSVFANKKKSIASSASGAPCCVQVTKMSKRTNTTRNYKFALRTLKRKAKIDQVPSPSPIWIPPPHATIPLDDDDHHLAPDLDGGA
jgi:hypothetical protein